MYEKVKKEEKVQDLFQLLEIEKAWQMIKRDKLKQLKVAFIDTGYDASKSVRKKINISQYPALNQTMTEQPVHNGTLFTDILSRYCYPADYLGPKIIALAAGEDTTLTSAAVKEQVKWAIKEQVDILSINFCSLNFDAELTELLYLAASKNIITLASAGNFIFEEYTFPACLDTVLACSSLDMNGQPTLFANINEYVDICAYEENVLPYLANTSSKTWQHHTDPLTRFLVTGSKPTMNMLFNTLMKNQLFGTSYSLPLVVALVVLAKSIVPQLNIKACKQLLADALTAHITYKTKQKEKKIGKINFIETLDYLTSQRNILSKIAATDFREQYMLQLTTGENGSANTLLGEIFDTKGTKIDGINTTLRYVIYPFNRHSEKPGYYYIEDGHLTVKNGRINWSYTFLPKGEYFTKLIDIQNNIINVLIKIKKS